MVDSIISKEIEHIRICLEKKENSFFIAYLALLLHDNNSEYITFQETCSLIQDFEIKEYVMATLSHNDNLEKFVNILVQFDKKALVGYMMNQSTNSDFNLPHIFSILAGKCAELKMDDLLIDVFPRDGEFLLVNYSHYKLRQAIGYQISHELYIINKIKASICDENIEFIHHSFLDACIPTATKYFIVPPFGVKISEHEKHFLDEIKIKHPELANSRTLEILYITKALDNLSETGKIICCLPIGFLSNSGRSYVLFRKWLIENHFVEACISLSSELDLQTSSIQFSFLILSKTDKNSFMVVDASKEKHEKVRGAYLDADNIDNIISGLKKEGEISKRIFYKGISESYNLNPNYFLAPTIAKETYGYPSVELSSIATIIRGCNSIQKDLESRLSRVETNIKYLSASWDKPNTIPKELDSLKDIKESEEKYCAISGDFILSKMGRPKFDVITNVNNDKIIVSGNLYIVRIDQTKVLPKFIKCFFEGAGNYLLENALTGSVTPTLSVDMLGKIKIPLIPMEKQKEIVNQLTLFEAMQEECYEKLEKINLHLESLFDDVMQDRKIVYFSDDGNVII